MSNYKFNPLKYGYEKANIFPELNYTIPVNCEDWYVKIIAYDNFGDLVYWYSAIQVNFGFGADDRVRIISGSHDFRKPNDYEKQNKTYQNYCSVISNDKFAKSLLSHIFGTTQNKSVKTDGIQRLNQNIGEKMRKEFLLHYA
jgi:hypothetical protein